MWSTLGDRTAVQDLPGRGRGTVATVAIPAGTLLLKAAPTAFVVDDARLGERCSTCLQPLPRAAPCERCGFGGLCAACAADPTRRRVHEVECASLARLREGGLQLCGDTRALRLLLRLLLLRRDGGERPESAGQWWPRDARWDGYSALSELVGLDDISDDDSDEDSDDGSGEEEEEAEADSAHSSAPAPPARTASAWHELGLSLRQALLALSQQARFVLDSDARAGHDASTALLGRLFLNCHELVDAACYERELGLAIVPALSALNHACAPNAHVHEDGGCVCARTVRAVAAGDEITISYTDTYLPAAERRAQLRRAFRFDCACARCTAPPPADAALEARLCARPRCGGELLCAGAAERAAAAELSTRGWRCVRCGTAGGEATGGASRGRGPPRAPAEPCAVNAPTAIELGALEAAAAERMRARDWEGAGAQWGALLARVRSALHPRHALVRRARLHAAMCARERRDWACVRESARALVRCYAPGLAHAPSARARSDALGCYGAALAGARLLLAEALLSEPLAGTVGGAADGRAGVLRAATDAQAGTPPSAPAEGADARPSKRRRSQPAPPAAPAAPAARAAPAGGRREQPTLEVGSDEVGDGWLDADGDTADARVALRHAVDAYGAVLGTDHRFVAALRARLTQLQPAALPVQP